MTGPREIELKLDAAARDLDRLERGSFLRSIGAGKPRTATLLSVYFDTDKLKLRRKQLSLRLRRNGDRRLQTIKATGNGAGLLERGEWEQPVATDEPDLEAARSTALEPVLSKKVRRGLRPVFETRVQRTTYPIKTRDSLVELAIDRGTIDTDRDSATINEVELELKRGRPADLFRLARTIANRAPLELALASKAERGYRLYAGEQPAPTKALPLALDRRMRTQEAFQLIARACLQQLIANLPVLRNGDPEGLHQSRVAIRRLRAAISLFAGIVDDDQTRGLKQDLRWIAGEFAPARELHVLTQVIEAAEHAASDAPADQQTDPPPAGLPALEEDLRAKGHRAFAEARAATGSARFRLLLLDLAAWIEAGDWLRSKDPLLRTLRKRPVAAFGADELQRRWKKVRKRGKELAALDPQRRHRLRIQAKKLRYAAEFLVDAFPGKKARKRQAAFLARLEDLQDCLGELNDIAVHASLTADLANGRARRRKGRLRKVFAAGWVSGHEDARIAPVMAAAQRAHARFARAKPFWS